MSRVAKAVLKGAAFAGGGAAAMVLVGQAYAQIGGT